MLARTADNLYWLARYVERAEYLARILEATQRLTAMPLEYVGETNEWESALATAGCSGAFFAVHEEANEETVTDFLAFSADNPSSIRNCFEVARHNARAVRTALTSEMWDAINSAWLEFTTSEPAFNATRVSPPGTMRILSRPVSTKGRRSTWRGAMPASTQVGHVESASVGWAMKLRGLSLSLVRKFAICALSAAGPISMP